MYHSFYMRQNPGSVGKSADVSFFFCDRDYESGGDPDLSVCLTFLFYVGIARIKTKIPNKLKTAPKIRFIAEGMTESAVMSETEIMPETEPGETAGTETDIQNNTEENEVTNMNVQVADVVFSATLEENEAVSALVAMMRERPVVSKIRRSNPVRD